MNNSFVALDFETACYSSLSACSLGIAVFNNGALAESKHWLLKPADCGKFSFTKVHGITWNDVKHQPSLKEIWPDLEPYLRDRLIIAHNAIFDMGLLKENLGHYGINYPNYVYNCTLELFRQHSPYLENHQLKTVCSHLSIPYGNHNAEADAVSCGWIFQHLVTSTQNCGFLFDGKQLENKSYLNRGLSFKNQKPADLTGISVDDVDGNADRNFFKDKCCVITGEFSHFDRNGLPQVIKELGGRISSTISGSTNYLIMGTDPGWSKVEKVEKMISEGKKLVIIDEAELLQVFEKLNSLK